MSKSRRGKCIDCGKDDVFIFSAGRCRRCWEVFKGRKGFEDQPIKADEPADATCNHLIGMQQMGIEFTGIRIGERFLHFDEEPAAEVIFFKYCPDCGKRLFLQGTTKAVQFETIWEESSSIQEQSK